MLPRVICLFCHLPPWPLSRMQPEPLWKSLMNSLRWQFSLRKSVLRWVCQTKTCHGSLFLKTPTMDAWPRWKVPQVMAALRICLAKVKARWNSVRLTHKFALVMMRWRIWSCWPSAAPKPKVTARQLTIYRPSSMLKSPRSWEWNKRGTLLLLANYLRPMKRPWKLSETRTSPSRQKTVSRAWKQQTILQ